MATKVLTLLDAINACLRGVGLAPVSSEDDQSPEAAGAIDNIELASLSILAMGWWFNLEYNWDLAPNTEGIIKQPNNTIDIIPWGDNRDGLFSIRDSKIYDMYYHTYDLSSRVKADGKLEFAFIMNIPFESLPEPAKIVIMYQARRLFSQDETGDQTMWKLQSADETRAFAELQRRNAVHNKRNALRHNSVIASRIAVIGGPNSYGSGLGTFPKRDV